MTGCWFFPELDGGSAMRDFIRAWNTPLVIELSEETNEPRSIHAACWNKNDGTFHCADGSGPWGPIAVRRFCFAGMPGENNSRDLAAAALWHAMEVIDQDKNGACKFLRDAISILESDPL